MAGWNYEFTQGLMRDKITLPTIHLCANANMNLLGEPKAALSATWQKNAGGRHTAEIATLKRHLVNYFTNKGPRDPQCRLWSCYKEGEAKLKGWGYTQRFLAYNTRATNAYRHCSHLALHRKHFCQCRLHSYILKAVDIAWIVINLQLRKWYSGCGVVNYATGRKFGCICQANGCGNY